MNSGVPVGILEDVRRLEEDPPDPAYLNASKRPSHLNKKGTYTNVHQQGHRFKLPFEKEQFLNGGRSPYMHADLAALLGPSTEGGETGDGEEENIPHVLAEKLRRMPKTSVLQADAMTTEEKEELLEEYDQAGKEINYVYESSLPKPVKVVNVPLADRIPSLNKQVAMDAQNKMMEAAERAVGSKYGVDAYLLPAELRGETAEASPLPQLPIEERPPTEDGSSIVLKNSDVESVKRGGGDTGSVSENVTATIRRKMPPVTRQQVLALRNQMQSIMQHVGVAEPTPYPTDMNELINIIKEENRIYDAFFAEIIRQVSVNMAERGEILSDIRTRYSKLFQNIPKHLQNMYEENMAQRHLNARLADEVQHSRETIEQLSNDLTRVRKQDDQLSKQAESMKTRFIQVMTHTSASEQSVSEYHKMYKMQRDRVEASKKQLEIEKRAWMDAATVLAVRISQEHGIPQFAELQSLERARLRTCEQIIHTITQQNFLELREVEHGIDDWRGHVLALNIDVVRDSQHNLEMMQVMLQQMLAILNQLSAGMPASVAESKLDILQPLQQYDIKSTVKASQQWFKTCNAIVATFTSDKDIAWIEKLRSIRVMARDWIEKSHTLLRRNALCSTGKDYAAPTEDLNSISDEIGAWLKALQSRISGDDGIATLIIQLENVLEDKCAGLGAKDPKKIMSIGERTDMIESLKNWTLTVRRIIEIMEKNTTEEQIRVPLHVDRWLNAMRDQLNTDTDVRTDENIKVHTQLLNWLVQIVVKNGDEPVTSAWNKEFDDIQQDANAHAKSVHKDSVGLQILGDRGEDLPDQLRAVLAKFFEVGAHVMAVRKKEVQHLYDVKHTDLGTTMAKEAAVEGIDALWASEPFEQQQYYADVLADAGQYISLVDTEQEMLQTLQALQVKEAPPADNPVPASTEPSPETI